MLPALLVLARALAGPAPAIQLAPAPGAPAAAVLHLSGQAVALDSQGRASVPATTELSAPGLRFFRAAEGGAALYLPDNDTLVTWPLSGVGQPPGSQIMVREHAAAGWEQASTFEAPVEMGGDNAKVRFALAPGDWDVAILVPGFAPAFVSAVSAHAPAVTTAASTLTRAASLKARILSARSGKPPARWIARLTRPGPAPKDEETRFFATRPIAVNRAALDFPSLPVGTWELQVEVPGGGRRRQAVGAPRPGAVVDLGDFVIPDPGTVRVTLVFPVELPGGDVTVRLRGTSTVSGSLDVELGSKTVHPKPETVVEFERIEPGQVAIESEVAASGLDHLEFITVEPGETTEDRIVLAPVKIHGTVRRGDDTVAGATVSSPLHDARPAVSSVSDDFGEYALRVWAAPGHLTLKTLPSGDPTPFSEFIAIDRDALEVDHDVLLPAATIRGTVRDADTSVPIADVRILATPSVEKQGEAKAARFETETQSDSDGRFELRNLAARRIDLQTHHKGYAPSRLHEVEPTPAGKDVEIRLEKGLRLHGVVTDPLGTALSGVRVNLDPDPRGMMFAQASMTSATGEFEFRSAATGLHVMEILECGFAIEVRGVDVWPRPDTPGEIEANVELAPETPLLLVHVEDGAGAPAQGWTLLWTVHGVVLPLGAWQNFAEGCGQPIATDSGGDILLNGMPRMTIGAITPGTLRPLGQFDNDGSQTSWTIRIPKEH
ncbi:MAG TPA: carboxypeptidase-like regulatory domain-containing protein [Thermoanaerobaculia bacterium]|nr:carboxypeptidase-like regulatory domain-containing protein [Thermoanaerobaculia bacterium]